MGEAADKAVLLTDVEMKEKRAASGNKYLFFDDGNKKIDYILAFQYLPEDDEQKEEIDKNRETFLNNLKTKGLLIQNAEIKKKSPGGEEYGTFKEKEEKECDEVHYIKIHAPFKVLCEIAEDMKTKMPTTENDIQIRAWYQKNVLYRTFEHHDPFRIKDPFMGEEKNYFVAYFDEDRLNEFHNHENEDDFFSPTERSRLVYYLLDQTKFGEDELDLGVYSLIAKGIFVDAYPLHDGPVLNDFDDPPVNDRQRLQKDWATIKRIFKYQPIPAIKSYFGEKVALYFAWLGFYTSFLVPAAILGIICFVYGVATAFDNGVTKEICSQKANNGSNLFYMCPLCDKLCSFYLLQEQGCLYAKVTHFFDNDATLFFAVVMSIWATVFLEFWKRRQVSLAYDWHTMDFEEEEERPRPEYLARVTRLKRNPVTLKMEPYMPARQRARKLLGAFGVVAFFIVLILAAITGVIVFRAAFYILLVQQDIETIKSQSKLIVSSCAACINLVAINILKFVYQKIALKLTQWENPRTNTDYEDSFTIKMFWFQFVNTYSSIFYVAFFKNEFFVGSPGKYKRFTSKQFRFEGCSVQGCFLELTIQLIIIMVGQQIIGNVMEIVIPYLKNKYNDYRNRNKLLISSNEEEPQWISDYELSMQTKFSLFWQYLEIVLQYGFVTMFVAAFPLAPFFALLNNLVEIRLDAVNFIHNFRRPAAERAEDIGAWYGILATLTLFSTIVNAFVLAFTSELIPRMVYKYKYDHSSLYGFTNFRLSYFNVTNLNSKPDNPTKNVPVQQELCRYPGYHETQYPYDRNKTYWIILSARLAFVLIFVVINIGIKWLIAELIPDMPKDLELKMKREKFLAAERDRKYKEKMGKRKCHDENKTDESNTIC